MITLHPKSLDGGLSVDYGKDGFNQSKKAAMLNPLEDAEMSELVWDVFCVLHSYDWYACSDTCEETYRKDVQRFKDKWLGKTAKSRMKKIADAELERVRETICKTFGIEVDGGAECP